MLKEKSKELNLTENVIFTGVQNDIQGWLSAFDIFIFPSLFEGLGIAGLEAEANGMPVFAANNATPEELKINNNFHFLNLNDGIKKWARDIKNSPLQRENRKTIEENFKTSGYNIDESVKKVYSLFLEGKKNEG